MLKLAFVESDRPRTSAGRQVNTWADESGRVFARAFVDGRERRIHWQGLGVFTFAPDTHEVFVAPDEAASPDLVSDMFARVVQPIVMQALGWQALHASAVRGPAGAMVFCGVGRSGKSTLAYACGRVADHRQVADDAVVLTLDGTKVILHPVPFRPKLREPALGFFGPPGDASAPLWGAPCHLNAIVILTQSASAQARPSIAPVPSAAAFSELLRHAHCFDESDPVERQRLVESYLAVVERVPVFQLRYRPALEDLPDLALRVLQAASGLVGLRGPARQPDLQAK